MQFMCLQGVTWALECQGPASVMWWELLGESFDFLVFRYKPLHSTSNVLATKFILFQCKCPSKRRHSEVLEWNKEGKDVYEDKLPAQEMCGVGSATLGLVTLSLNVFRSWLN